MSKLILTGPGGCGKDHLRKRFESRGFKYQVSYTTRPPREGEVDGVDYFFISKEKAQEMIENDEWYEYVEFHGWLYGTSKEQFFSTDSPIFIMTPIGISLIKPEDREDCFVVYIDPDPEVIMQRLKGRNMPGDTAERRYFADVEQFKDFKDYDMRITTHDW